MRRLLSSLFLPEASGEVRPVAWRPLSVRPPNLGVRSPLGRDLLTGLAEPQGGTFPDLIKARNGVRETDRGG